MDNASITAQHHFVNDFSMNQQRGEYYTPFVYGLRGKKPKKKCLGEEQKGRNGMTFFHNNGHEECNGTRSNKQQYSVDKCGG